MEALELLFQAGAIYLCVGAVLTVVVTGLALYIIVHVWRRLLKDDKEWWE